MSTVIESKIANFEQDLKKKREYLGQVQNAERQTTQEIIAMQGAIEALKSVLQEEEGGASDTVESEIPQ
jgi:hypothetical protein